MSEAQNTHIVPEPKPAEFIATISLDDLQSRLKSAGIDFADKMEKFEITQIKKAQQYGIEELKDVVLFGIYLIKAIVLKETNVIARWLAVVTALPGAIVGISDVPFEIADMDETELNELVAFVKSFLPEITNQDAIKLIEYSIKTAYNLYNIVILVKELKANN